MTAASEPVAATHAPRAVRYAVLGLAAVLIGGAILLTLSRGPAILIDLAGGVKAFFCM